MGTSHFHWESQGRLHRGGNFSGWSLRMNGHFPGVEGRGGHFQAEQEADTETQG